MTQLELDKNGYPTDETLRIIRGWRGDNWREFFATLKPIWKYSDKLCEQDWCSWDEEDAFDEDEPVRHYFLITGGWSGNESLIAAMEENFVLWSHTWLQSRRGGHYIFEVERERESGKGVREDGYTD